MSQSSTVHASLIHDGILYAVSATSPDAITLTDKACQSLVRQVVTLEITIDDERHTWQLKVVAVDGRDVAIDIP